MRYRDMVLPIMVSILLCRGDAAADLVEPVEDQVHVSDFLCFRTLRRLEHGETLPVGMEGEGLGETST